jgi:hypothetical protein
MDASGETIERGGRHRAGKHVVQQRRDRVDVGPRTDVAHSILLERGKARREIGCVKGQMPARAELEQDRRSVRADMHRAR